MIERVYSMVEASVGRYADRVSRVAVHLGDDEGVTSSHSHDDIRCAMEVRMAGRGARGVSHHAGKIDDAVAGAARKLRRVIEHATRAPALAR